MKKILLFIVSLLLLIFAADRLLYCYIKKDVFDKVISGGAGGYIHYLTQRKRNVDFLVMGNSRARLHINPDRLRDFYNGNGFNAGISAVGGVFYNHVLLDMLLREGIKPKAIILQTDAYLYYRDDKERELSVLLNFIGENPVLDQYVRSFSPKDRFLLSFRLFRCNGKLLNLFYNYNKIGSIGSENGYAPQYRVMDTLHERVDTTIVREKHTFLKEKTDALKAVYDLCQANGIRLIIVTTPTYCNSALNPYDDRDLKQLIDAMPGVRYIPMNDIDRYPMLSSYENWGDINHFNDKGATLFSGILNDSLKAMP